MADSRVIAWWRLQDELRGPGRSITVGPGRAAVVIADGVYGEPHIEGRVEPGFATACLVPRPSAPQ